MAQEQSRSNPGALLSQLRAAQETPRQQLALMQMLQDSLQLASQAPNRAPSPDQGPQVCCMSLRPGEICGHKVRGN